ncbi:MAG: HAD-IIIA family hydrolase [Proteobacteria bacterium]|nr:HAD-IIIA family hydrolase [Pseudomonadota bacterium]
MPSLHRPKAFLFDLGDTLLQEESYHLDRGTALLRERPGFRSAPAEGLGDALYREMQAVRSAGHVEFRLAEWLAERMDPEDREVDELEFGFWREIASLVPMPGVREGLDELVGAGVPMGVVSNAMFSARVLESELRRHGLRDPFRFVISSADHGRRKPHESIFRAALDRLGADAADTWFVGDRFEADVIGAHAVGMTPIWLNKVASGPPAPEAAPHHRVQSWPELIALHRAARTGALRVPQAEAGERVFAYGTLEFEDVMEVVTGRSLASTDALLPDYARFMLRDRIYPAVIESAGDETPGRLYGGVDAESLVHLDRFEGSLYRRERVRILTESGVVDAFVYVLGERHRGLLRTEPWDRERFRRDSLTDYLDGCRALRSRVHREGRR